MAILLENNTNVIEVNILIIGGGFSGLWAANRASELIGNILVVDKGPALGFAGQGYFSGGGMQACPPDHDPDAHVKDIVYLGDGLYEQDILEKVFRQSWDRIRDFEEMGVVFIKESDGKLRYIPQRGLANNACYLAEPMGSGGNKMTAGLVKVAKERKVKYLSRTLITELIKENGSIVGAAGFNIRSGEFIVIKAKAVILATGGCSFRGGYEDTHMNWGEGPTMALNAGAELRNLEFITIWMIPKKFRWEGVTYLLPLGAKFVNNKGDEFMERYAPTFKSNTDYNYLARAMAFEAREGRGPFYLDCGAMTPENKRIMTPAAGWTGVQYQQLLQDGIRPFEERQEWTATVWGQHNIYSDLEMRTGVPGLFVAGAVRNIDPGVYFGGWMICKTAATGRWAAESAADYVKTSKGNVPISNSLVMELRKNTFSALNKQGFTPEEVLIQLQESFFSSIILKTEKGLKESISKVERIRDEVLPRMGASDLHQLAKHYGIKNMVQLAELILRASILRTESRASHYRADFPDRNDNSWLKWILASTSNGKIIWRHEELPVKKYKHQTWKCYGDNFRFPKINI